MKREDRLSAGMSEEQVKKVTELLKASFELRRRKLREIEERERSDLLSGEKR